MAHCRDLIDEEHNDGNASCLPRGWSESKWKLVLECPVFDFGLLQHRFNRRRGRRVLGAKRKKRKFTQLASSDEGPSQSEVLSESNSGSEQGVSSNGQSDFGSEYEGESAFSGDLSATSISSCNSSRQESKDSDAAEGISEQGNARGQPEEKSSCMCGTDDNLVPAWLLKETEEVLLNLANLGCSVQPGIDGTGNVWILKPGESGFLTFVRRPESFFVNSERGQIDPLLYGIQVESPGGAEFHASTICLMCNKEVMPLPPPTAASSNGLHRNTSNVLS